MHFTVVLLDAHASSNLQIQSLLCTYGFEVCRHTSASELAHADMPNGPTCLIVNVHAFALTKNEVDRALLRWGRQPPILLLVGKGEVPECVKAFTAGTFQFVTTPIDADELIGAVRRAVEIDGLALERQKKMQEQRSLFDRLTRREKQIFALVVTGKLNKQIARELNIAEHTVKIHRGRLMRKLGANSVAELVVMSMETACVRSEPAVVSRVLTET